MTGVITGAGLGLFNSSANVLGGAGLLGQDVLGQAKQRSYVNAATGNLILQSLDEVLSGRGADLFQQRTYNSLGQLDDGDGDGWRWDGERTIAFTAGAKGEGPGVGGSVTRTDGAGHRTLYTWDGTKYVSTDGDGAHDSVRYEASTPDGAQWVWTDGTTRLEERYDAGTGRLASQKDVSGNLIEFGYTDGRLTSITDHGSGQWIELVYDQVPGTKLIRLKQVNTHELMVDEADRATAKVGAAIKRVEYSYDMLGRLTAVKTDLTPENAADDQVYITAYGYDAASGQIASVSQSDGTVVRFTYKQSSKDGPWRIDTVTDASGVQTFEYDDTNHSTRIGFDAGDGLKQAWTYVYDTNGQLTQIQAPGAGGVPRITTFEYETEKDGAGHTGNVKRIVDALGNAVDYQYDPFGNRILERDAEGDTITRTYNSANQLETETHYTGKDPDGNGAAQPAGALTSRFVYDDATHTRLLFAITPEGRVTRSIYGTGTNDAGLLTQTIHFTADTFDVSGLSSTQAPTEADMTHWVNTTVDKQQLELTQFEYDLRGNTSRRVDYAAVNADGQGVLADDQAATVTDFIYDAQGFLRQTIAVRGANRSQTTTLTSFDVDGLGRETKRVTAGATVTTAYDGTARTVTATNEATGLVETRTYDEEGRLVSVSQAGNASGAADGPTITRQALFVYDLMGRLRMTQDAQGNRNFSFYDAAGQLQFTVDSTGAVCQYEYDQAGQLISQTHFADAVPQAAMSGWIGADGRVIKSTLDPGTDFQSIPAQDRNSKFLYDRAGRLTQSVDPANTVTTTTFDGASRIRYQQTVDRVTRFLYDHDGLQIGVVDPLGYLTETRRDAAGRVIETIRYTHRSSAAIDESAPLWVGVQNQTVTAYQTFSYRMPAIDADGDPLQYSIVGNKPDWLDFDQDTATLSGVPLFVPREFTVTVRADDGRGKVSDVPVTFTVVASPPIWAQLRDVTVPLNTPDFVLELPPANNPQHTALTYSVVNPQALPQGLTFSVVDGVPRISGTPTQSGSAVVTLQVTDGQLVTQRSFTLAVITSQVGESARASIGGPPGGAPPAAGDATASVVAAALPQITITVPRDVTVPEGDRGGIFTAQSNLDVVWSLSGSDAQFFDIDPNSGDVSYAPGFEPDFDGQRDYNFSVNAIEVEPPEDGKKQSGSKPVSLHVVNQAPEIAGVPAEATFDEGTPTTQTLFTVVHDDPGGGPHTFEISGDTSAFTFEPDGEVKFAQVPDFDTRSRYVLTFHSADNFGGDTTKSVTIDVRNLPPTIFGVPPTSIEVAEGMDPGTTLFPVSALDAGGGNVSLSLAGADAGAFHIVTIKDQNNQDIQAVQFREAPNFETKSSYSFVVRAVDATNVITDVPVIVNVTNVAPTISGVPVAPITVDENFNSILFTAKAFDPPSPPQQADGLRFSLEGGDAGVFRIDPITGQARLAGADFETKTSYAFFVVLTDGGGASVKQLVTVNLRNSPPAIFGGASASVPEGTPTSQWVYFARATDGGGDLTYTLDGPDADDFTINSLGLVYLKTVPNYETRNSYSFTVRATDGTTEVSQAVTLTITDLAPTISGPDSVDVQEETAGAVFAPALGDAAGGPIKATLEGPDAAFFTIDADTGEVRFRAAPDFETRTTFSFTVRVGDGTLSTVKQVTVHVTDLPKEDDLATWRPADTEALHSYMFYDGQNRLVGSVNERGFLTVTDYDDTANQQLSTVYLNPVTVSPGNTLDDLKTRATAGGGKSETTTTKFDSFGRVSLITAVDGTTARYVYDAASRLVQRIDAEGQFEADGVTSAQRSTRTRYDSFGDVTGILGGKGDAKLTRDHPNPTQGDIDDALESGGVRYEYDDIGLRIRSIDANGNVTRLFYDDKGRLTHTVNARGEVSELHYNTFGEVDRTRLYDTPIDPGKLSGGSNRALQDLLKTDALLDRTTSTDYDQRGLVTRITDALGFETDSDYTVYGELFRQTRTIQQAKDGNPKVTTTARFDHDLDGRLISTTEDESGINSNVQTGFDAYGRVIRSVDGAGKVTTTRYEDGGRTIVTSLVVDGQTRAVRDTYDAFNRVATHIDALGNPTKYEFDDVHRKLTVTTPEGVKVTTVNTRSGEVFTVTDGRQSAVDPSVATTSYTYDENGNLLTVRDALGHPTTVNTYDDSGRLRTTQNARGTITSFEYDELNRVFKRHLDPAGLNITSVYEFDSFGGQMTVTEAAGTAAQRVTSYSYYNDGRLKQMVVDPQGLKLATSYRYDGLGNTVRLSQGSVDDPDQQVTIYQFDALGRRTAEISAPSSIFGAGSASTRDLTVRYSYNAAGQVSRRTDENGSHTWFVYNEAGELTDTIGPDGALIHQDHDVKGRVIREHRYRDPLNTRSFGETVTSVTPSATSADQRSYFVYDNDDNQRFVVRAMTANVWLVSETRVDADGNVIESRAYDKGLSDAFVSSNDTADSPGFTIDEVKKGLREELKYSDVALGSPSTDEASLAKVERTRYAYDRNNGLRFVVDAMGGVTESVRNAAGDVIKTVRYATRPSLSDFSESGINNAVKHTDANNQVTYFARDAAGRLRFVSRQVDAATANSETSTLVTETVYDALDHVVETIFYSNSTGTGASPPKSIDYTDAAQVPKALLPNNQDRISASTFDAAGREIYRIRASEVTTARSGNKYVITRQDYDDTGDVVKTTAFAKILALADFGKKTVDDAIAAAGAADDPDNRTTSFIYDKSRRLHFTVAADGSFSEDIVDGIGQLMERRQFDFRLSPTTPRTEAALIEARGSRAVGDGMTRGERYTRDLQGHVLTKTDAAGNEERSTYDVFGNRQSFIDKNGVALLKQHPDSAVRVTWTYVHDLLGQVTDELSPLEEMQLSDETAPALRQLRTHYGRDAFGNLTVKGEALDTVDMRITGYEYDNLNQQTRVILPGFYDPGSGRVESTFATGRFRRTLDTTYDAFGNAVRTKLATGPGPNDALYEYETYDLLGQVQYDIDALHNVTRFGYDAFGDQGTVTRYSVDVGAPDPAVGLWSSESVAKAIGSDPFARTTTTLYDNRGNKIDVYQPAADYFFSGTDPAINAGSVTPVNAAAHSRFDYDAFGDLVHDAVQVSTVGTGSYNGPGTWRDTLHFFNTLGQETLTVDALGFETARVFDPNGNLAEVTEYANAGGINLTGSASPGTPNLTDALAGRVVAYDLPVFSDQDRIVAYGYDALNRQTSVARKNISFEIDGGDFFFDSGVGRDGPGQVVLRTTYDASGNVHTVTDALGNVTTTDRDTLGRIIQVTEPARLLDGIGLGQVDPFKNQVTASPVTRFTLNAFGQNVKTVRSTAGGESATLVTVQGYDLAGNLISVQDPNLHTTNRQYDFAGRLIKETRAVSVTLGGAFDNKQLDQTIESRYAYDAVGHLTDTLSVYTADGNPSLQQTGEHRAYNAFGEVTDQYKEWGDASLAPDRLTRAIVAHFTYDNAGHEQTQLAGDGETHYFYDLTGQITRQEQKGLGSLGAATANTRILETGYDILGRAIIQRLPEFGGESPFARQSYDRWGNVTSRSQGGTVFGSPLRVFEGDTTTFEYNYDDKLIAQHDPTVTAYRADTTSYQANVSHETRYDILGNAVLRQDYADDASTSQIERNALRDRARVRHYDAAGEITSETDATGHEISYAYDGNGYRVGTRYSVIHDARADIGIVYADTFDNNGNILSHSVLRQSDGVTPYFNGGGGSPIREILSIYLYDQADRRYIEFNSADNNVTFTWTQYDERNLVTGRSDGTNQVLVTRPDGLKFFTDPLTTYSYDEFGNRSGTVDAVGNSQSWTYSHNTGDYTVGRLDHWEGAGGPRGTAAPTKDYGYDAFGELISEDYASQDAFSGQTFSGTRTYEYGDNGLLQKLTDATVTGLQPPITTITEYGHNPKGQAATEHVSTYQGPVDDQHLTYQRETRTAFDALGRIQNVTMLNLDHGGNRLESLTYNYDERGNRREIAASYQTLNEGPGSSDRWYTYDSEDRLTTVDGVKDGNAIVADTTNNNTTFVTYDQLGRRATAIKYAGRNDASVTGPQDNPDSPVVVDTYRWDQFNTESYQYDDLNNLIEVKVTNIEQRNMTVTTTVTDNHGNTTTGDPRPVDGQSAATDLTISTYTYDLGGERRSEKQYTIEFPVGPGIAFATAVLDSTTTSTYGAGGLAHREVDSKSPSRDSTTDYHYDGLGNISSYDYDQGGQHFTYTYTYSSEFGGTKLKHITQHSSNSEITDGGTSNDYDAQGNLIQQIVRDAGKGPSGFLPGRRDFFVYDNSGHIIRAFRTDVVTEETGARDYFYVEGQEVGAVGNGLLRTAQFNNNFTPISDAYPATSPSSYTVNANDTLAGIAQLLFGDAQLWYLIADANSLAFGPNDPLPTSEVGKTYRIPNVVSARNSASTFTPYNPASIYGSNIPSPYLPGPGPSACQQVGQVVATIVVIVVVAVVTYYTAGAFTEAASGLGETLAPIVGAGLGGATGNLAGQATGLWLGTRNDLSGKEVLAAGLSAAAMAGIGELADANIADTSLPRFADRFAGRITSSAVGEIANDVVGIKGSGGSIATSLIIDGALTISQVNTHLDTADFKWSTAVAKVVGSAIDPDAGWAFHSDGRSWATIASQTLSPFAEVAIGGLLPKAKPQKVETQRTLFGEPVDLRGADPDEIEMYYDLKRLEEAHKNDFNGKPVLFAGDGARNYYSYDPYDVNANYRGATRNGDGVSDTHVWIANEDGVRVAASYDAIDPTKQVGPAKYYLKYANTPYAVRDLDGTVTYINPQNPVEGLDQDASEAWMQNPDYATQIEVVNQDAIEARIRARAVVVPARTVSYGYGIGENAYTKTIPAVLGPPRAAEILDAYDAARGNHTRVGDTEFDTTRQKLADIVNQDRREALTDLKIEQNEKIERAKAIGAIQGRPWRDVYENKPRGIGTSIGLGFIEAPLVLADALRISVVHDARPLSQYGQGREINVELGKSKWDGIEAQIVGNVPGVNLVVGGISLAASVGDRNFGDNLGQFIGGAAFGLALDGAIGSFGPTPDLSLNLNPLTEPVLNAGSAVNASSAGPGGYYPTRQGVLAALRAQGTRHATTIADAIDNGHVDFTILPTDPTPNQFARGTYEPGSNEIVIHADQLSSDVEAAGTTGHEGVHWLQDKAGQFYNQNGRFMYHYGMEYEAFRAQIAIDPLHRFAGLSDYSLYQAVKQEYGPFGVPSPPRGWKATNY